MGNLQFITDHDAAAINGGFFDTTVIAFSTTFKDQFLVQTAFADTFQSASSAGILGTAISSNSGFQGISQGGTNFA